MSNRPKFPTDEQIDIAVEWLKDNEDVGDEQDACVAVANWLERARMEENRKKS